MRGIDGAMSTSYERDENILSASIALSFVLPLALPAPSNQIGTGRRRYIEAREVHGRNGYLGSPRRTILRMIHGLAVRRLALVQHERLILREDGVGVAQVARRIS